MHDGLLNFDVDTNCTSPLSLFCKISNYVFHKCTSAHTLKVKNADHFSQYVTEDFDEYIKRKRANNCHGNNIEMQALSEMYNRTIEVYKYSLGNFLQNARCLLWFSLLMMKNSVFLQEPINTFHASYQSDYEPIRLSYHNNIHYNSIIDPYNPSVGVGLGLAGYNPKVGH